KPGGRALEFGQQQELATIRKVKLERVELADFLRHGVGQARAEELVGLTAKLLLLVATVAGDARRQAGETALPREPAPLSFHRNLRQEPTPVVRLPSLFRYRPMADYIRATPVGRMPSHPLRLAALDTSVPSGILSQPAAARFCV